MTVMPRYLAAILAAALITAAPSLSALAGTSVVGESFTPTYGGAAMITAVTPATGSYTSGVGSGAVVGTIGVATSPSPPTFPGFLALTGTAAADFSLSNQTLPSNLVTNGSTPTCTSTTTLSLNIVARQDGFAGSPYTQAVTITCNPVGSYAGPCDVITGGCAEAYSMTRAATLAYRGSLFQIALYSSPSTTMDVVQGSNHMANLAGVLSFCGGTYANCAISKIYAQIQGHGNDVVANFNGGGPANEPTNCGNRNGNTALSCACPLTIDATSGVPYAPLSTAGVSCQYTLPNDAAASGITGGSSADISNILIGRTPPEQYQNCSSFGAMHGFVAGDTQGTDFGIGMSYGSGAYAQCSPSTGGWCLFPDLESNGTPTSTNMSSATQPYVVGMMSWAHSTNLLSGVTNGHVAWTPQAPPAIQNTMTSIHIGGGGDLCSGFNIAEFNFYEGFFTNSVVDGTDYTAVLTNTEAAYPSLTFP